MKKAFKSKLSLFFLILFLLIILACIFAPLLTHYSYSAINPSESLAHFSKEHPLGTDRLGRDMVSRLLYGGRVTLGITLSATLISLIGIIPGLLAGYYGGWLDALLQRIDDAVASIPTFLLVILAEYIFGWGRGGYRYAIGIALIPPVMKLTRSLVQEVMAGEYITAAKVLGIPDTVIIFRHVLRNILPSLLVFLFHTAADALMLCTVTGYLEIGVQPPIPEWGTLVHGGYTQFFAHPEHLAVTAMPIIICVLSLNIIGNAVRDTLGTEGGGRQ